MPIENDGQSVAGEPSGQPSVQAPRQPTANQKIPTAPTYEAPNQDEPTVEKLEQDIRMAEWWLIGIGIVTLLVNVGIAKIYYGQLIEMRNATGLTRDAVQVARDTLTETQNSNKKQRTDNAAAAADAKRVADRNAAQSEKSLQATIDNFHQDQRAWLGAANPSFDLSDGKPLSVSVGLQDTGKTPALNLDSKLHWTELPANKEFTLADVHLSEEKRF